MMRTGVETMQWRNMNPHFQRMLLFSPPFFFLLTDVQEKSETFRPLLILAECTGIRYSSFFAKCSWLERGKKRIYICWKISESFRQDLIPQISCSLFLSSWVGAACINPFIAKGSSSSCIQFPWGMKGHFILLRWWSGNSLLQLVQWLLASVFPSDYLCVCQTWLVYTCGFIIGVWAWPPAAHTENSSVGGPQTRTSTTYEPGIVCSGSLVQWKAFGLPQLSLFLL